MDRSALTAALAGVVAIPVIPFGAGGGIDRDAYRLLLRRLLDGGIATVTPNGNTGEFYALTPQERQVGGQDTPAETPAPLWPPNNPTTATGSPPPAEPGRATRRTAPRGVPPGLSRWAAAPRRLGPPVSRCLR